MNWCDFVQILKRIGRFFHADLPQPVAEDGLGLLGITVLPTTSHSILVQVVREEGRVPDWNARCEATFPADAIQSGDVITRVNDQSGNVVKMMEELAYHRGPLFVVFWRALQ